LRTPLRHYYAVRNSILLYRRPYSPKVWIVNDALRLVRLFCFHSVFGAARREHAGMMLKGMWHGIRGRSGRLG
jgi:rhamnosyltransferase